MLDHPVHRSGQRLRLGQGERGAAAARQPARQLLGDRLGLLTGDIAHDRNHRLIRNIVLAVKRQQVIPCQTAEGVSLA